MSEKMYTATTRVAAMATRSQTVPMVGFCLTEALPVGFMRKHINRIKVRWANRRLQASITPL